MIMNLSHSIVCYAEPQKVFSIISTPERWPSLFEPCIDVNIIERKNGIEQISVTALINGHPQTWQSRRNVNYDELQIDSEMITTLPFVASMCTRWRIYAVDNEQTLLVLEHDYEITPQIGNLISGVKNHDEAQEWIKNAIDTNSVTELKNIRDIVENFQVPKADEDEVYHASYNIVCENSAEKVFSFIADPLHWPNLFKACVSVENLTFENGWQNVKIHANQAGHHVSWVTRRKINNEALLIDYELVDPMPYTKAMKGRWRVVPLSPVRCLLAVDRSWLIDDNISNFDNNIKTQEEKINFINQFINTNTRQEMKELAFISKDHTNAPFFIETKIDVDVDAEKIYQFLKNAEEWPSFVPHCQALHVKFNDGVYQELFLDVKTSANDYEIFRTFRICNNEKKIISFVQVEPPHLLKLHHGSWNVVSTRTGARVTCLHFVTPRQPIDCHEQNENIRNVLEANSRNLVLACVQHIKTLQKEKNT